MLYGYVVKISGDKTYHFLAGLKTEADGLLNRSSELRGRGKWLVVAYF